MHDSTHSGLVEPHHPTGPFSPSDLPLDTDGRIYHIQVRPEQIAPNILLVGDPGRAEMIGSKFLRDLELEHEHRGLATVTGTAEITCQRATIISPVKTTVATTGMGTPSLEIVVNELVALNEIDLHTRTRKPEFPRLHVIRVGTSGALQAGTALGTPIITTYAIGLDNTGLYYDVPCPDETCERLGAELGELLQNAMDPESRFYGKIHPYVSRAEPALVQALVDAAQELGLTAKLGLTVSSPGFYAPQGRDTARIRPAIPQLDQVLSAYDPGMNGQRIENFEMESSFLIHFLGGLGYWAGAICPAIAHRRLDIFDIHYDQAIENATRIGLLALATLRNRYPDATLG